MSYLDDNESNLNPNRDGEAEGADLRTGGDGGGVDITNYSSLEELREQITATQAQIADAEERTAQANARGEAARRRQAVLDALAEAGCTNLKAAYRVMEDRLTFDEDGKAAALIDGTPADLEDLIEELRRVEVPEIFADGRRRGTSQATGADLDFYEKMKQELSSIR